MAKQLSEILVQPEAAYVYANPALERLSGDQKILIRMGSENANLVKLKLTRIGNLTKDT